MGSRSNLFSITCFQNKFLWVSLLLIVKFLFRCNHFWYKDGVLLNLREYFSWKVLLENTMIFSILSLTIILFWLVAHNRSSTLFSYSWWKIILLPNSINKAEMQDLIWEIFLSFMLECRLIKGGKWHVDMPSMIWRG